MASHNWVAASFRPIKIEKNPDGSLGVFINVLTEDIANADSILYCWFCHEDLTPDNVDDECPGEDDSGTP